MELHFISKGMYCLTNYFRHYNIFNLIIYLQYWRRLSKLQRLIVFSLSSLVLISLLLWFIGITSKHLEEALSEINSLKLPQLTSLIQDSVCLIFK